MYTQKHAKLRVNTLCKTPPQVTSANRTIAFGSICFCEIARSSHFDGAVIQNPISRSARDHCAEGPGHMASKHSR